MAAEIQTTDEEARVYLPRAFADCTVLIDQISDTELRIRRAGAVPADEVGFVEEQPLTPLSDQARDAFLAALDNPPPPNEALQRAAAEHFKRL